MNAQRHSRVVWLGLLVWAGLLAVIAYGDGLNLPFTADDFFHLPYVDTHDLAEIWQSASGLFYYRPVSFALWKLLYGIFGRHDPVALHALNLALHVSNGFLVAWLAGRLWSSSHGGGDRTDWIRRYLSATLFLLYPFSYQAVPWSGALVHPLVTALILLSLVGYRQMRATRRRMWAIISLAFTLLSPFAHENGVVVGPLIAAIEFTRPASLQPWWRKMSVAALWTLPAIAWLLIARQVSVTPGPDSLALNTGRAIFRNSIYFAQGAGYPLTWLGGALSETPEVDPFAVAAGLTALALIGAALCQWRGGPTPVDRRAWLPWLWIGLTAAPAVLFLPFRYVSGAPRILMLPSVGVAWLWTDVFLRLADSGRVAAASTRLRKALAVGLCTALAAQNFIFIRQQMQVYALGGAAMRQAEAAALTANAAGQAAILINLPAWIAPALSSYALGQEGVFFLPEYTPLDRMPGIYTGYPSHVHAARFDAIRRETPYHVGLRAPDSEWSALVESGGQVFVTRYAPDTITLEPAGALWSGTSTAEPLARFGQSVALLESSAALDGARLHVELKWRLDAPSSPNVTVFVHILDASGQLIAQADGDPLAGTFPFALWPPGLVVSEVRTVETVPPGFTLRIGLYDGATGERLAAMSPDGTPFADNGVPIAVQPIP